MNRTTRRLADAELLKLRTVPLPRTVLLAAVATALAGGHALVRLAENVGRDVDLAEVLVVVSQPLFLLAVLVAVFATAGELQHRTVRATLLHAPRRGEVAIATAATSAAYGVVLTLLAGLAALGSAAVTMRLEGLPVTSGGAAGALAATVAIAAGWAVLGAGLGMLTRSTTASIAAVLVWKLGLEGVLPVVTRTPELAAWLPGGAADAVLQGGQHYLEPAAGGAVFAAYAAAFLLTGTVLFSRRDPA